MEEKDAKILDLKIRLKSNMENTKLPSIPLYKFKCDPCTLSSISEPGKKDKEPTVSEVQELSEQCSFCDVILNDKKQLKKRMRTHSYGASLSHINPCPINFLMSHNYFRNLDFWCIYIRKKKNNLNEYIYRAW